MTEAENAYWSAFDAVVEKQAVHPMVLKALAMARKLPAVRGMTDTLSGRLYPRMMRQADTLGRQANQTLRRSRHAGSLADKIEGKMLRVNDGGSQFYGPGAMRKLQLTNRAGRVRMLEGELAGQSHALNQRMMELAGRGEQARAATSNARWATAGLGGGAGLLALPNRKPAPAEAQPPV